MKFRNFFSESGLLVNHFLLLQSVLNFSSIDNVVMTFDHNAGHNPVYITFCPYPETILLYDMLCNL